MTIREVLEELVNSFLVPILTEKNVKIDYKEKVDQALHSIQEIIDKEIDKHPAELMYKWEVKQEIKEILK